MIISGALTPPGQSEPGNSGKEGVLHIPKSSSTSEPTLSDVFVSHLGH